MAIKFKTHRGAAKRFRKKASGLKRKKAYLRHNLRKHSHKKKRSLRQKTVVSPTDYPRILKMISNK